MWCVKLSIPGDKFFDAMHDVSEWLSDEQIDSSHFSYARDMAGEIKFRINFLAELDAVRFATRFDGSVLVADCLGN